MAKLKQGSAEYERRANRLARDYITIVQCRKCGNPVVDGYCCPSCKDVNPYWSKEQEHAWYREHDRPR